MYLNHFGLREYPFSITPDTEFFFSSSVSQEALNTLLIATKTGEGFLKITGEVGTGKTMLCRKLMAALESDFKVAFVPNPFIEPRTFFLELAAELGIQPSETSGPVESWSEQQLLRALTEQLLEIHRGGKRAVVLLDEAQAMPIETLEALRLLTNLETEKRKLLQVVIFGQPELEEKLNHPSIRQLRQRITFDYCLTPMSSREIDYYIHHRLRIAGHQGGPMFTPAALWQLKRATGRVPRLVNILAHKALLSAFGKGRQIVTFGDVRAAVRDTTSLRHHPGRWRRRWGFAAALIVLSAGGVAWWAWLR